MKKPKPFFSICIPVYNGASVIARCLDAIMAQKNRAWEIVIVDDGSTDDTLAVVQSWSEENPCDLKVESIANHGAYYARTRAYELAQGEIIVNVDADDCLACANALDLLQSTFEATGADLVIYNASTIERRDSKFSDYSKYVSHDNDAMSGTVFSKELALGRINNVVWEKAFKAKLAKGLLRKRDVNLGEDRLITAQIADRAEKVAFLDEILYCYQPNEDSITLQGYTCEDILKEGSIESLVYDKRKNLSVSDEEAAVFALYWLGTRLRKIISKDISFEERRAMLKCLCRNDFSRKAITSRTIKGASGIRGKILLLTVRMRWIAILDILAKMQFSKGLR